LKLFGIKKNIIAPVIKHKKNSNKLFIFFSFFLLYYFIVLKM